MDLPHKEVLRQIVTLGLNSKRPLHRGPNTCTTQKSGSLDVKHIRTSTIAREPCRVTAVALRRTNVTPYEAGLSHRQILLDAT
jgi:hypothetical protein